jgi:hypothetical protein
MSSATTAMEDVGKASEGKSKKGLFHSLSEGLKLLSLGKITSTLDSMKSSLEGTGNSIDDTFKKMDTLFTKMSANLGPEKAKKFGDAMMQTMVNTGLTADETETLALRMTEVGTSVDDTVKALPIMGKMVASLGLDAEHVATMFGQGMNFLRATPEQMKELAGETVKLQKAYGLTDLFGALPEVINSVTENAARFGKVNTQSAMKSATSVLNLVGVFQKYGKSQKEAIAAAVGFNNKLGDMKRGIADMKAGLDPLDDSIFDLQEALVLAGVDGQDAFDMIMNQDPDELMKSMKDLQAGMDDEMGAAFGARIRRIFGDDVANLAGAYGEEMAANMSDAEKKMSQMGDASTEFDKMTDSMSGTMKVQERLRDAAKNFFDLTTSFANKADYIKALQAQRSAFLEYAAAVADSESALGKLIKGLDLFSKFGLTGFLPGAAGAAILLGILSGLIGVVTMLAGALQILAPILSLVGSAFSFVWGIITTVAGALWSVALEVLPLLWTAFTTMVGFIWSLVAPALSALVSGIYAIGAAVLANPIGLAIAAIIALGAAVYLVVKYWDDIKAAAIGVFNWLSGAVEAISGVIVKLFTDPVGLLKSIFGGLIDYVTNIWSTLMGMVDKITGIAKTAFEFGSKFFGEAKGVVGKMFGSDDKAGQVGAKATTGTMPFSQPTVATGMESNAVALPSLAQMGAPGASGATKQMTAKPSDIKDKNTLGLIAAIEDMRDTLDMTLHLLIDKPTTVALKGDAKKFFKASNQEAMGEAGALGMGGAVTR